jgi:hypothetical protein
MLGVNEFLCDGCNLTFRGWIIPGTMPERGSQKRKRRSNQEGERPKREQQQHQHQDPEPPEAPAGKSAGKNVQPRVGAGHYVRFLGYYGKLLLTVVLRTHRTSRPLGIKYRWRNWRHWQRGQGER